MRKEKASLLLHPLFIISLAILLLNDFYWKYSYHNWLTGKLSDFAGLIVLPVFLLALIPMFSKRGAILFSALFFVWWKSMLSQSTIDLLNSIQLPVVRVVDYTDLFAFLVLPLVFKIDHQSNNLYPFLRKGLQWMVGTFAIFSLCATSMPYRSMFQAHPNYEEIYFHETIKQKRSSQAVLENLTRKRIFCRLDSVMYYPVINQDDLYYRVREQGDSAIQWQPVSTVPDSTLFLKREGSPYYLIPECIVDGQKVQNVRFTLSENRKATKTEITVETFQAEGMHSQIYLNNRIRENFKKLFRQLFQ